MLKEFKATVTLDAQGRISIPVMIREALGLKKGDIVKVTYNWADEINLKIVKGDNK